MFFQIRKPTSVFTHLYLSVLLTWFTYLVIGLFIDLPHRSTKTVCHLLFLITPHLRYSLFSRIAISYVYRQIICPSVSSHYIHFHCRSMILFLLVHSTFFESFPLFLWSSKEIFWSLWFCNHKVLSNMGNFNTTSLCLIKWLS